MTRQSIPERARIFVGCEGESEEGYSAFLARLARDHDLPVAVDANKMKGGDPLSRIEWAREYISREEEKRGAYSAKFAFLDTDQAVLDPGRADRAVALADQLGITIIWQQPDHEGLVLLHFDHTEKKHPTTKAASQKAVLKVWGSYKKNSTGQQYRSKLTVDSLKLAGRGHSDLNELLMTIGLVERAKDEPRPERAHRERAIDLGDDESA
ncbi:MAG TPA: RloB domain-containing protein [Ensifer sp.]|nr:RloB domain-containing protein [Ensifer sp.]